MLSPTKPCTIVEADDGIRWVTIQELPSSEHTMRHPLDATTELAIKRVKSTLTEELNDVALSYGEPRMVQKADVWHFEDTPVKETELLLSNPLALYSTLHDAWALHGSVVLSPDDIWIAVQLQFARYMRKNAEKLREKFVSFDDKEEIVVSMDDAPQDYALFMTRAVEMINDHDGQKVNMTDNFCPEFTSSTHFDRNMKSLAIMENMKHYYNYTMSCMCGITKVGLLGKLDDWQKLFVFVAKLVEYDVDEKKDGGEDYDKSSDKKYGFTAWIKSVLEVCTLLVDTYLGEDSKKVTSRWNEMLSEQHTYGSGASTYISGWLLCLMDYTCDPEKKYDISDLSGVYFNVPVTYDNNGSETKLNFVGGFTGTIYDASTNVRRLHRSYAVIKSEMVPREQITSDVKVEDEADFD